MKIFIVGETHSGKSTLAKYISKLKGYDVVSAGFYMKENYLQGFNESKKEYTDRLTKTTKKLLKKDKDFFINKIKERIDQTKTKNIIIEGIRNPKDFSILFEPGKDIIIRTTLLSFNSNVSNDFERRGLHLIDQLIVYFNMIKKSKKFKVYMQKKINIEKIMSPNYPSSEKWWNKEFYDYIHSIS